MIRYRAAAIADAATLAQLGARTFTETFGHLYSAANLAAFLENHASPNWQRELGDAAFSVRLAEADGRAIGFAKLGPPSLPYEVTEPTVELRQLYVLQPWQGEGVAAALMDWALAEARARGAEALALSVFVDNHRARRFYARYGFEAVGQYQFMVGDHADHDLILRKPLGAGTVEVIRADLLEGVPHGFLGRSGGVSEGVCAGLNVGLGSGDDPSRIAENRRRAVAAVAPGARLATVYQVHSADVARVAEPWSDDARPHADALVTARPGVLLGILTADCTPVLFADRAAGVVGAAHAGWKGALGGVLEATVAAMVEIGADRARILAAVGPTIGRKSYEVDAAFLDRFVAADENNDLFFSAGRPGHHQFDLEGYVLARLAAAGVRRIEALGLDTYTDDTRFYSYRRATHRGEPTYGRQLSAIARPPDDAR